MLNDYQNYIINSIKLQWKEEDDSMEVPYKA